jgi:hypothetical protein
MDQPTAPDFSPVSETPDEKPDSDSRTGAEV